MTQASSKNVFLFYGEDDFRLRQKINVWKTEFAKKYSATSIVEFSIENLSDQEIAKEIEEITAPSLFSTKKLIIARNCLPTKATQIFLIQVLEKLIETIPSDYFLVFWQDNIDRRLGFIKSLVKQINVTEFQLPHGLELNSWIKSEFVKNGVTIDDRAINKLAVLVGRDLFEEKKAGGKVVSRKEMFDLWQVSTEIQKLIAYGGVVTEKEVEELVAPQIPENVFALSNAVVSQNKQAALSILENLMDDQSSDEKNIAIKIIALLSEQFRSQLIVNLLSSLNMNQSQIAEFLGWSSGRVFITLKHSANANMLKLKQILQRLLIADATLKSTDTNPKLLIDLLIIS